MPSFEVFSAHCGIQKTKIQCLYFLCKKWRGGKLAEIGEKGKFLWKSNTLLYMKNHVDLAAEHKTGYD